MSTYSLSGAADADIEEIAEPSMQQWGLARAERYILGLHETFRMLSQFPEVGRDVGDIRPGHRKIESESHSVFYRKVENGVLIVRVLHQRMNFRRHI